jgi:hypothetical protein
MTKFSVMMLDGRMLCFPSAGAIRQLLEVFMEKEKGTKGICIYS